MMSHINKRACMVVEPAVVEQQQENKKRFSGPGRGGLPTLTTPARTATSVKFSDQQHHGRGGRRRYTLYITISSFL